MDLHIDPVLVYKKIPDIETVFSNNNVIREALIDVLFMARPLIDE